MPHPIFTVGHSTRPISEFIALLGQSDVAHLVDVRKMPRSRSYPQFNGDALQASLHDAKIGYEHVPPLGGLRGKSRDVLPETNAYWENASFHNYADYAMTAAFQAALRSLHEQAQRTRLAIMCSEAVWWRCHRRIIADHLLHGGETVIHIVGPHRVEPAKLTPGAVAGPDGSLTYPADDHRAADATGSLF